jgi:hypothetical protein
MFETMLTLTKRDAKIGRNINCRTEDHGDEDVKGADIRISGVHLEPEELNAMLQEPHAHNALFKARAGSKLTDPMFRCFAPFRLVDKIEHANVVLFFGVAGKELKLGICKLKGITLDPKAGGMTEMSCLVQATPTLDKRITDLISHMGKAVQIEIGYEHNAEQPDLELGAAGRPKDGDEDDDDDEDDKPTRGRKGSRSKNGDRPETH